MILLVSVALAGCQTWQQPRNDGAPVSKRGKEYSNKHRRQPQAGKNDPQQAGNQRSSLLCVNAERYAGTVVGNGHCVSLIKKCSNAPDTNQWRPGEKVLPLPTSSLKTGTVIATFLNGHYPNKTGWHAAIYISHNDNGIWVWDQWKGKHVHKRFIRTRKDRASAGNSAQHYRVVTIKK